MSDRGETHAPGRPRHSWRERFQAEAERRRVETRAADRLYESCCRMHRTLLRYRRERDEARAALADAANKLTARVSYADRVMHALSAIESGGIDLSGGVNSSSEQRARAAVPHSGAHPGPNPHPSPQSEEADPIAVAEAADSLVVEN